MNEVSSIQVRNLLYELDQLQSVMNATYPNAFPSLVRLMDGNTRQAYERRMYTPENDRLRMVDVIDECLEEIFANLQHLNMDTVSVIQTRTHDEVATSITRNSVEYTEIRKLAAMRFALTFIDIVGTRLPPP